MDLATAGNLTQTGSNPLGNRIYELSLDVYNFINTYQSPAKNDAQWYDRARAYASELQERIAGLRASMRESHQRASARLSELERSLRNYRDGVSADAASAYVKKLSKRVASAYEAFASSVRGLGTDQTGAKAALPQVRPKNYLRNLFHAGMGIVCVGLYHWVLTWQQAMVCLIATLGLFGSLEISRIFSRRWNSFLCDRLFGWMSRPYESNRMNSATWYLSAMTVCTALLPQAAVEAGILVLAFGDPMASLIGKKWGRKKLYHNKSWIGSAAFLATAFAVVASFMFLSGSFPLATSLVLACGVAIAGTLAELFSERLDDNLTIPMLSAGVASLLLFVLV